MQGIRLSGARRQPFPHNDLVALDRLLRELVPHHPRVLVAVEGVYSMDGDLADLAGLVELRRRYGFMLYLDEAHSLGVRDLATSASTRLAAERAGVNGAIDVAELHAPFSHQEPILREALGLGDGVDVNPSGGALSANVMMAAGLTRVGEAAERVIDGRAGRAVAHATSGPCLQQNLVCVLDGGVAA